MGKIFTIGDIHGAYKALIQCLQRSNFDYENDTLICLGDLCDGWPETKQVIDELLKIKNLIFVYGNHDLWLKNWLLYGDSPLIWLSQGGKATINSYKNKIPQQHVEFINTGKFFYKIDNKIFVHGGFEIDKPIDEQNPNLFIWDRTLIEIAYEAYLSNKKKITSYDEVYVGHTPTLHWQVNVPLQFCEVFLMDTGAGWNGGRLSMINIETKELYTSDIIDNLYPGIKSR